MKLSLKIAYTDLIPSGIVLSAVLWPALTVLATLTLSGCSNSPGSSGGGGGNGSGSSTSKPINDAAHEFSPSWVYNQINGGADNGSDPAQAMQLIIGNGIDTLYYFPYNPNDYSTKPDSASMKRAIQYKESGWMFVSIDINSIKQLLSTGLPVAIAIKTYDPDFDNLGSTTGSLTGDVYCTTNAYKNSNYDGDHEICLVGYDDNKGYSYPSGSGSGAFRFINSWGTGWDDNGYGWISYSFISNSVIEEAVTFNSAGSIAGGSITLSYETMPGSSLPNITGLRRRGVKFNKQARIAMRSYLFKSSVAPLGSSADISGSMPPVGNQGIQNSCVGWAIGYYMKTYLQNGRGW